MKQMRASVFKARCLAVMDAVQATGEPVIVTKRGKPVVKVVPIKAENDDIFGFMAGQSRHHWRHRVSGSSVERLENL